CGPILAGFPHVAHAAGGHRRHAAGDDRLRRGGYSRINRAAIRREGGMRPRQRLLVSVDPQLRHSAGLQRAVALAEPAAARLHVVALVELPALVALLPEEVRERTRDGYVAASRSRLEEQLEPLRRQGLQISGAALATEDRKAEILRQAAEL